MSFQSKARKPQRRAGGKEAQKAWPRARAESSLRGQVLGSRRKVLSGDTPKQKGLCGNLALVLSSCTQNVQMEEKAGTDSTQVSYAKVTSMENLPEYQGTLLPAHCLLHICFYLLSVFRTGRCDGYRSPGACC